MANNISNDIKNKILNFYKQGKLLKDIALETGVHYTTISRFLKNNNFTTIKRKYIFNEHIFDTIDSEEKAYWVGFLFADGSNDENGLRISLQGRDKLQLEKFLKFLKLENNYKLKERKIKDKTYFSIKIHTKIMQKSLYDLGIKKHKTKNPEVPNIPQKFIRDFLRGFFDGDGCVYFQNKDGKVKNITCFYTINEKCIEAILKIINSICPSLNWTVNDHWRTSYIKSLRINGVKNCVIFLNTIYVNSNIYLDRKYAKFLDLINYVKLSSKVS
jgi:intein-encoded DNA endonuclease-like protein